MANFNNTSKGIRYKKLFVHNGLERTAIYARKT